MLKRFLLSWSEERGYYVDLPTYSVVQGTHAPTVEGLSHIDGIVPTAKPDDVLRKKVSVLVQITSEVRLDGSGQIVPEDIRARYKQHPYYGSNDYTPPKIIGDR